MGKETSNPSVILADDDVLLREGLASLLEHSEFDSPRERSGAAGGEERRLRVRCPARRIDQRREPVDHRVGQMRRVEFGIEAEVRVVACGDDPGGGLDELWPGAI